MGIVSPSCTRSPWLLTLLCHVQSLYCRLHWECPRVARAGLSQCRVCLLAVALFGLLKQGFGHRPLGACAGWKYTLHQLLHSQEVSAIGMGMSAQLPKVFTLY